MRVRHRRTRPRDKALEAATDILDGTICECGHPDTSHLMDAPRVCADDLRGVRCRCRTFRAVAFIVLRQTT